ncbi:sperm associated antigen 5 [Rhinolophus ferrumequinum]|uniref:Sperm associated antigen 5 n=2 Tax=Rhinolophus ferrumequinum TaxID=59479 RepID=A0A671FAN1_RHIFE|nr:sperm-associated antigen 5 isoform X2 [Rhinolophus ferrumequinum]KAF6299778.1 sperm associated antigen 5 [Rhinolophus ferrumequinum]
MWRVKKLNLSLSPSSQPGIPAMRTPLQELNLQPGALTNSGKGPPISYSLTPSLCKLGLQEDSNNSSPLDVENAKMTDSPSEQFSHPSKWLEACQHESDDQPLNLIPQTNSAPKTFGEAGDPLNNNVIKTGLCVPSPGGLQQDITLEAHLDTMAATNSFPPDEPLRPGDLLRQGVAVCVEDSLAVVPAIPEKPTFQNPPSHLLDYPPNPCSEQHLHCSKESPRDDRTEAVPEDLVSSERNAFSHSSMLCLSPSPALVAEFPVSHVAPGEATVEHRAIEEREMSFPTLIEEAEVRDQALVSNVEDIPSSCLTPNPGEMESQAAPGPAVEDAGRILISDTGPWMSPLTWLEKGVNTSVMLENLRQSLSLPSVLRDATTGTTPLSTCSVGTWLTPPAPQEKSSNTSQAGLEGTKDGTSGREHLLWGHPPDLTALSRHDLEDNLMNSLVILEVLSCQLRNWKSQLTTPHPEVQDSSTQIDSSPNGISKKAQYLQESQEIGQALQQARNVMQSWALVSKELISLLHLSLLHLEEDKTTVSQESRRAETLVSCCFDVLKKLRARLQSLKAEREEAKLREEMALRGKDAAETVLEVFCAHAVQRISQLEQDLGSMGKFRGLLKETQTQLVGLHTEQEELAQQTATLTSDLQQDWTSMQLDYITWTALLSRSRQLMEKLTAKSRQTLQERDAAIEEKQQVSRELEHVSTQLEDCRSQIEKLELENSRLATDLRAQLQSLASMHSQLEELRSQHAHCTQDLAVKDELLCQLTQSSEEQATQWQKEEMALKHMQAKLEQQHAVLTKEVQDLKETLEFADQENQVAHLELGQVECQLKSTLEVLRERSLQCEELKDTVENLRAKLASTIAENQEKDLEKTRQYSQELRGLTEQLQSLTLFLQTKLKEKAEPETLPQSTACAQEHPAPTSSTFLGSILTVMADKEPESAPVSLLGSDKSAFTRVASVVSLQPTETPRMEKSLAEMNTMTLELQSLCSLLQESKEEAIQILQRKICDLQARLEAQEEQHQEAQKAKEVDIEKLNQALCLRYKNEKELQEVIQQQNEKILEQIDKSGELISLREEVTQLTRSLRRAETETKVLQETLASQLDPNCQPMATNWIQEKVWLSQEVDKLRVMFLEMKNEKANLTVKFQSHRNILEENLRRSDKELKKLDDIVQHIYETLLSIPEVVRGCKELQGLLDYLS